MVVHTFKAGAAEEWWKAVMPILTDQKKNDEFVAKQKSNGFCAYLLFIFSLDA